MKKLLSLLLCLAMVLSLTACGQSGETQAAIPETTVPETSVSETTAPVSHYPITVKDQAGWAVSIPKPIPLKKWKGCWKLFLGR